MQNTTLISSAQVNEFVGNRNDHTICTAKCVQLNLVLIQVHKRRVIEIYDYLAKKKPSRSESLHNDVINLRRFVVIFGVIFHKITAKVKIVSVALVRESCHINHFNSRSSRVARINLFR